MAFPPAFYPYPQIPPADAVTYVDDLATNLFAAILDDPVPMGDLVYNYLAGEANATYVQLLPNWSRLVLPVESTYKNMGHLSPTSPSSGYTPSPSTANYLPLFSPSPSPPLSQTSSTLGYQQESPEPSPAPELNCRAATPTFNHIRKKWCCSACDKPFRGKWECNRHIGVIGRRAKCLACGGNLNGREDSLRRHYKKYCKGDVGNIKFEDVFIEVQRSSSQVRKRTSW